jgi:hypothetical protein
MLRASRIVGVKEEKKNQRQHFSLNTSECVWCAMPCEWKGLNFGMNFNFLIFSLFSTKKIAEYLWNYSSGSFKMCEWVMISRAIKSENSSQFVSFHALFNFKNNFSLCYRFHHSRSAWQSKRFSAQCRAKKKYLTAHFSCSFN